MHKPSKNSWTIIMWIITDGHITLLVPWLKYKTFHMYKKYLPAHDEVTPFFRAKLASEMQGRRNDNMHTPQLSPASHNSRLAHAECFWLAATESHRRTQASWGTPDCNLFNRESFHIQFSQNCQKCATG